MCMRESQMSRIIENFVISLIMEVYDQFCHFGFGNGGTFRTQ